MGRMRVARIHWDYPKKLENIYSGDVCNNGWGIYAISRKFGDNETLLYIGLTFHQNFIHRIKKHHENWIHLYRGEIKIRLGQFISPLNITKDLIEDIESCLIYELKPVQNICKSKSYCYIYKYKLFNTGFRGQVPAEVSMYLH